MAEPLIVVTDVVKQYKREAQSLTVLDRLTLSVEEGDFVALMQAAR